MKISDVAGKTGLSPDTLRFYEKIGLIARVPRDDAGHRDYGSETLDWIRFLEQLNATGMKQADRIRYAHLREEGPATVPERRRMLEAHRDAMLAQKAKLEAVLKLMDSKVALYREMEAEAADV